MKGFLVFFYNLVLALWVGGMFIFTFVIAPVIFKSHARDMAGSIVGHIFPYYFLYNLALSGIALFLFSFCGSRLARWIFFLTLILLITALILNIFIITFVYPKMEKLEIEIGSFESSPPDLPARKSFGRMHGLSAAINLFVLIEGILLIFLARHLGKE